MNRPGPGARAMGSPSGAFAILSACVLVVVGVVMGILPVWLVLFAMGFANGTITNVQRMRAYNAWAAGWQAFGGNADAAPERGKWNKKNPVLDNAVGVVAVVALPWLASQVGELWEKQFIGVLWLLVCLLLLYRAVRGIVRRVRRTAKEKAQVQQAIAEVQPVAWLVQRASSSPSRADAMQELPEYSARMLGQQG